MVIGEDSDLIILLIHFVNKKRYRVIFFYVKQKYQIACEQLGQYLPDGILAIYALLDCNTTSRVFIGKGVALAKFQKDELFNQDKLLFLEKDILKAEIEEVRERVQVSLYSLKANNSLDQIRLYKISPKDCFK